MLAAMAPPPQGPGPLEQLQHALQAGDVAGARSALEALRRAGGGTGHAQLAAEVFHELRQPLLGIKAYAQMMEEEAGRKGPLGLLLAQVDRMEQIISDYTRLVSQRAAPQERVSLNASVGAAVQLFRVNPDSARLSLEVDAPTELSVQGNARLLEQLTLNLLNNARDAMAGLGRVKVVLAREGDGPALYVADWGPGIPPDMRERLFEPYATSKRRGTGLGLAVCRRIAQEHGAQLSLVPATALGDSPPPATVFRVLFPSADAQPAARPRVLVVDDEAIIRRVFRDLLAKECEVLEADTAEEALGHLRVAPVDLIVTDKNLPGLSGLDLAQEARRLHAQSRVILMTGYPSVLTAQQAIELGVLDYLLKPFDEIREVRDKIRAALAAPLPQPPQAGSGKRVDVYEDDPDSARQLSEALSLLGLEARVYGELVDPPQDPPTAVVVSWDFSAAHGRKAVELGRTRSQGAPFVVLSEHLTMEAALESLRGGAAACLPKLLTDTRALSRELSRALKLG